MSNYYKPSLTNFGKYGKYLKYFYEYIVYLDFTSLFNSLRYMTSHKGPSKDYEARSRMGKFLIRKGTTDFQFINYEYERKVRNYLKDEVKKGNVDDFYDIGACIGEFCVWLSKIGVNCVAFEPVNADAIAHNKKLNKTEFTINDMALGNESGSTFFNSLTTQTGASHRLGENDVIETSKEVKVEKFDNLYKPSTTRKAIIKLDVESMEEEVLDGATEFIQGTTDLRIIYERYPNDERVDKKLQTIANFKIEKIDDANYMATKI